MEFLRQVSHPGLQTDANAHRATQWHSDADYLTAIIDTTLSRPQWKVAG
jgi:hypothetical protein